MCARTREDTTTWLSLSVAIPCHTYSQVIEITSVLVLARGLHLYRGSSCITSNNLDVRALTWWCGSEDTVGQSRPCRSNIGAPRESPGGRSCIRSHTPSTGRPVDNRAHRATYAAVRMAGGASATVPQPQCASTIHPLPYRQGEDNEVSPPVRPHPDQAL